MVDENERMLRKYVGDGLETWVPAIRYEKAMASGQEIKQKMLEVYSWLTKVTEHVTAMCRMLWWFEYCFPSYRLNSQLVL